MSAAASFQHHQTVKRELARVLRMLAGFLLGFALAAWVCFANAAMTGYQLEGRCLPSQAEALEAFKFKAQQFTNGNNWETCGGAYAPTVVVNTSATAATAAMAIKYYVAMDGQGGNGMDVCSTTVPKYLGIPACDPDLQSLFYTGTNALFLVLGFFYAGMLGFKTGYRA